MCIKVAQSLIWEELWGFCGICGIPDWNWPGCSLTCPLGGQEEGLDLEMCSGRGVGR